MLHQDGTVPVALVYRLYPNERQIPMRLFGMIGAHLLEDGERISSFPCGDGALDHGAELIAVGVDLRRQPQRRPCIAVHIVGAPMSAGVAPECSDKWREMGEVLMRVGIDPARRWIRAKCQGDNRNNGLFISGRGRLNLRECHGFPPSAYRERLHAFWILKLDSHS